MLHKHAYALPRVTAQTVKGVPAFSAYSAIHFLSYAQCRRPCAENMSEEGCDREPATDLKVTMMAMIIIIKQQSRARSHPHPHLRRAVILRVGAEAVVKEVRQKVFHLRRRLAQHEIEINHTVSPHRRPERQTTGGRERHSLRARAPEQHKRICIGRNTISFR